MIEGIEIKDLIKHVDERGFFTELMREDWKDLLQGDNIVQFNLSHSYPNIVRAWHRHLRGQIDYFICLDGAIKICAYDDRENSRTNSELFEIILSSERQRVVRIPGMQKLLQHICDNGFEHHVAANLSQVADALYEAFTKYLGWEVYYHKG